MDVAKWTIPPRGGHMDKRTGIYLQNMTGHEVEERLKQNDILIVPLGATEAHGAHAPLGEDVFLVCRMAEEVAARTGCTVAQPLWYGSHPYHHLGMPGTVVIPEDTFTAFVRAMIAGFWNMGFRKQILLNGHGQEYVIPTAMHQFAKRYRVPCLLLLVNWYHPIRDHFKLQSEGGPYETPFIHADEVETSWSLALFPELIDMRHAPDNTVVGFLPGDHIDKAGNLLNRPINWYSQVGAGPVEVKAYIEGVVGRSSSWTTWSASCWTSTGPFPRACSRPWRWSPSGTGRSWRRSSAGRARAARASTAWGTPREAGLRPLRLADPVRRGGGGVRPRLRRLLPRRPGVRRGRAGRARPRGGPGRGAPGPGGGAGLPGPRPRDRAGLRGRRAVPLLARPRRLRPRGRPPPPPRGSGGAAGGPGDRGAHPRPHPSGGGPRAGHGPGPLPPGGGGAGRPRPGCPDRPGTHQPLRDQLAQHGGRGPGVPRAARRRERGRAPRHLPHEHRRARSPGGPPQGPGPAVARPRRRQQPAGSRMGPRGLRGGRRDAEGDRLRGIPLGGGPPPALLARRGSADPRRPAAAPRAVSVRSPRGAGMATRPREECVGGG